MKISNTYSTFLLLLLFFGATTGTALGQQDIVMRGLVVLQNSKTLTGKVTYLPDVNIRSLKTTPTMSDSRGQFKLVFANVNYGAKTELTARKTGMMVVNQEILKEAAIVGRADTLKVVMCDETKFEDNKQRFYSISTENLQRELARRVNKLQRANAVEKRQLMDSLQTEMNFKLTSAEDAIAQLENRSKSLEVQLEKISHDFASVNLDDASETYRLAYKAFTEGDVKRSLDILNAIDFKKRLQENVVQISRRDSLVVTMQRQNDTSRTQISQDIQSCLLMANNHRILFQHREAQDWYETAIRFSDTTNLSLLNDYTSYLYEFGEFTKATRFNDITLRRARLLRQTADSLRYTEGYAMALFYRASLLSRKAVNPKEIQEVCLVALPFFEQFALNDTLKRFQWGRLMSDLAQAYSFEETKKGDSLSIVWYQKTLLTLQIPIVPVHLRNDWLFYQSIVHLGLGNTYRYIGKLGESERACWKAIEIRSQLLSQDTVKYAPLLSLAYTMLAGTFNDSLEFNAAILATNKSLVYANLVTRTNPIYSRRETIRALLKQARSYCGKEAWDSTTIVLDTIKVNIDFYRKITNDEWIDNYLLDYISVNRLLVIHLLKSNQFSRAEQTSSAIYDFIPDMETALTTFAIVKIFGNRYEDAVQLFDLLTENKKKAVKSTLNFFEKNGIRHQDFARLRQHFEIQN
jgi:tetratricopeptide (TPR) repeat protein